MKNNKLYMLISSIGLVVLASMLMMVGMLVPVTGYICTDIYDNGELKFELVEEEYEISISKKISEGNDLPGMGIAGIKFNLFDILNRTNHYKNSYLFFQEEEAWDGSTYFKTQLSLAQTAVAGFAFFMIAIPVIGIGGYSLYNEKNSWKKEIKESLK